ncbi:putative integral membrane channel protein [Neofusicoccum parvum UCRNP2]|uniref:Putative integral membrane channel protein n=1 Tax=Botryosphaeria parva (strain UCR-NP2) TaxID=1287680 RepID=R1G597_BOTPV|nr:putative integral membrane channel protein [Neofusicoccum parvum UCRNP2]
MLASLLRPRKGRRRRPESSPFSSPFAQRNSGRNPERDYLLRNGSDEDEGHYDGGVEDEDDDNEPVLPIFSAEHLDRLPIYNITHSIRLLVLQRCETTLSWDQLRSPQVSQFLVKPIQQEIRATLFSRGTLYALIANCLQFQKQGQLNPGNVGVEKTRGLICELLAMRLLKEFSTPRISAVEVAIRAQAKKFLAHPLVVQQLEAIWSGTIVFHSYADSLHRSPTKRSFRTALNYGSMENGTRSPGKLDDSEPLMPSMVRRTVTLYDPREASMFKLSRLRVPRYRQLFSTCSFAVMLGLFLAVLVSKSVDITALEVLFWFWSAGFMLDEVVGFTEQGFNLYILSVWNAFDLGILLLFVVYYVMRLYGILMPDVRKHHVADMAYDVLASTAVLLFPRLFSVLDHYRYFSQLLIAFRMMAMDLMAILILIIISCSGFFVAFTLAFGDTGLTSASSAAYALFQMLMGFTPAAWDIWGSYNPLGKAILTLFLFIAHFLIVTILITVLTNSFMAVVQNANEEHQFLFAVNTISMVKSDALFSYIAPTNIIAWLLTPIRFLMPFRSFVKMNRTLIKVTHFPILFAIFTYEQLILSRVAFQPEELVEQRGRSRQKTDADGDDELVTNDENDDDRITLGQSMRDTPRLEENKENQPVYESSGGEDYFRTPIATKSHTPVLPSSVSSRIRDPLPPVPKVSNVIPQRRHHNRNVSTNTILFSPQKDGFGSGRDSTSTSPAKRPSTAHRSGAATPRTKATPKRPTVNPPKLNRPDLSPRNQNKSSPNLLGIGFGNLPRPPQRHRDPSFNALALDLASDLGDNRPRPELPNIPGMSASFSTQMEMAAMGARRFRRSGRPGRAGSHDDEDEEEEDRSRTNRILLARMNTLEESFKEVLKEVRGLNKTNGGAHAADKKGKQKKGTRTPATPGTRTPGAASSAGGGSTGTAGTAIHDGSGDDRASIRRIDEEQDGDLDSSRSSV